MARLISFNFLTLNGFYKGPNQDISWHRHGEEESEYAAQSANADGVLVFGRITYEMMAGFWPSEAAYEMNPAVAKGMNKGRKIVFSRTMKKAEWSNTTLIKDDMIGEMKKLKKGSGKDMAVLGSGNILSQFAEHNLIDEYQIMMDPVLLNDGASLFKGIKNNLNLRLIKHRVFKSGVILLCYEPVVKSAN